MFSFRPVLNPLAVLAFLLPSLSVFAQQEEERDSSSLLMTNYNALREEGQGFYLQESSNLYEKPGSVSASVVGVYWWCDLEFSSEDATTNYGYVGRTVFYYLGSSLEDSMAQGAQSFLSNKRALSVSAVLVPTLGIFEGQFHATTDDWGFRYWDDGSSTLPILGWEGHDEGDASQNSDTSAWSGSGVITKVTPEAAAKLLGMEVNAMTPTICNTEYEAAWNASHVLDPIDTSLTKLEETVAQLQVNNKELLSRIVAIEGSRPANGSATTTSASSPFMAAMEHTTTTEMVVKSIVTVVIIVGLVAVDFM